MLLSEAGETLKALEYLQELGKYHHDHVKGLILMGDIYINDVNNFDMAENVRNFLLQRKIKSFSTDYDKKRRRK